MLLRQLVDPVTCSRRAAAILFRELTRRGIIDSGIDHLFQADQFSLPFDDIPVVPLNRF